MPDMPPRNILCLIDALIVIISFLQIYMTAIIIYLLIVVVSLLVCHIQAKGSLSVSKCIEQHRRGFIKAYNANHDLQDVDDVFFEIEHACTLLGSSIGRSKNIPYLDRQIRFQIMCIASKYKKDPSKLNIGDDLEKYILSCNVNIPANTLYL